MLKMKITFLELLKTVFSFLVTGDEYHPLVIFHSRVTINTFQSFSSVVIKDECELITFPKQNQERKPLFREVVSVPSK